MLKKVIMPTLGLDMESATIQRWLKAEGDRVEQGESLVEVETDKATTEIESPESGILKQIMRGPGADVPVTQVIAWIDDGKPGEAPVEDSTRSGGKGDASGPTAVPTATTGAVTMPTSNRVPLANVEQGKLRASPAARHLATELGVDLGLVAGSGPGGRIQGEDVRAFARQQQATKVAAPARRTERNERSVAPSPSPAEANVTQDSASGLIAPPHATAEDYPTPEPQAPSGLRPGPSAQPTAPVATPSLPGRLVPLSRKRRITAERMALSSQTVARLTLNLEVDASEMVQLRTRLQPSYQEKGLRLSHNDLLIKVVAVALKEHPYLNAQWTDDGIYLVEPVNVGMAVAVEDGLLVPVLHDAYTKKLEELSAELSELVSRARESKLTRDDMAGGTFTITNLGMYGIDSFTPIVNPPEAAILGVGQIAEKPVGRNGQIVLRPMMSLSLSVDHRIVDGAPAAQFFHRVKQLLEEPYLLL